MSKSILILALCSLLSACVYYTPMNVTYSTVVHNESTSSVVVSTSERTKTNEVSERVVQKTQNSVQRSLADCEPFVLPRDTHKPKPITDADLLGPRSLTAMDQLLTSKLKEYQTYIDSQPSRIEQAHNKWLEACLKKVPN